MENDDAPVLAAMHRRNLFDELIALRDEQRAERQIALIKRSALPWEVNQHGIMQWFMHPSIKQTAHQAEIIYIQRIPPGSRSGRQRQQGGGLFYVLAGRGHTVLDGETFHWGAHDCLQLPVREEGVVFQHFNDDSRVEVELIYVEAGLTQTLGVDRGTRFEEVVDSPDFSGAGHGSLPAN
jgi:gentisate 1,2-dioxygenase